MNLHGEVVGQIQAINPSIVAMLKTSSGYTTNADGTQVPTYTIATGSIQVQAFSTRELDALKHLDNLNMESVLRKIYAYGNIAGIIRVNHQGGDLLVFNNQTWLVVQVLETWPDWCAVVVELQTDGP